MDENAIDAAMADVYNTVEAQYQMTLVELRMEESPMRRVAYYRLAVEHLVQQAIESGDRKNILMANCFEKYAQLHLFQELSSQLNK